MPFVPGDRVGPYEIVSAIGAGGMGEVFKARDSRVLRLRRCSAGLQPCHRQLPTITSPFAMSNIGVILGTAVINK